MNAGLHLSLFNIDGKTNYGLGPRLSFSYRPSENWAVKVAYAHGQTSMCISFPRPIFRCPLTNGCQLPDGSSLRMPTRFPQSEHIGSRITKCSPASVEGYYKIMRNLVDYRDEYYLQPPTEMWNAQLCSGKGMAKGIDFKIEKLYGKADRSYFLFTRVVGPHFPRTRTEVILSRPL